MADTLTAPTDRDHRAAKRYIYAWGGGRAEGNAQMRDLLGGKGAGLAEMTIAGLPTPPGFTITTEACNDYFANGEKLPDGLWDDVLEAVREVERETGKGFGDPKNPLLVSVRSGAKFSMPGMMDTVLNLGLNEETLNGLIALTGNERFGWDAYRRFVQMFGRIVMDVPGETFDHALDAKKAERGASQDTDLDAAALRELVDEFKGIVRRETGRDFPTDPYEQLDLAIKAVFRSWFGQRARDYRRFNKIPDDLGTAVNVVTMVFGNMGDDSGTGVAFTRDPNTGENTLFGEYLTNAQGEDVVAGIRTPAKIAHDLGTAVNVVTMVFGNMGDDSGTGVAFTRDPNTGEKQLYGEYLTNAQGEDVVAGIRTPFPIAHMQGSMPSVYAEFLAIGQK
ncbi:MAG: PEP/pyruvate-binding domain-containing protein, partial [Chloroflexota bacterium]